MKTALMLSLCWTLVSVQTAQSDCVDAEDLLSGVEVEYADGVIHRFQRIEDDMVELRIEEGDNSTTIELLHGFYVVSSVAIFEQETFFNTRAFDVEDSELHVPAGPATWSYASVFTSPIEPDNRMFSSDEKIEFEAFEPEEFRVEECSYTYIPVVQQATQGDSLNVDRIGYIPSIGLILILEQSYNGEAGPNWTPVSIRTVE